RPNQALQRTRPSRSGCNSCVPWAGSLGLGREAPRKLRVNMPAVGEEQKKPPILELGDVRLRPLRTSDAPALLAYLSDPRVIEHTSIPIATPESVAAAVARDMAAYREGSSFRLALASSDDRL